MQALHTSLHCYVNEQVSITIPLLVHIKQEDLRGEEQSAVLKLGQQRSVITNRGLDGVTTYLKFLAKLVVLHCVGWVSIVVVYLDIPLLRSLLIEDCYRPISDHSGQ